MLLDLGIRFDMDLRSEADNKGNALGANVIHKNYPIAQYSGVLTEKGSVPVRALFAELADPKNYPLYLHCTYGADRTGTICYLLEALLGVSDVDLRREYELTTFTHGMVATEEFVAFVTRIEAMEGSTTQEKVENYLLSIGVTPEEI
jgi:protein tyrosine/serine phosphatase